MATSGGARLTRRRARTDAVALQRTRRPSADLLQGDQSTGSAAFSTIIARKRKEYYTVDLCSLYVLLSEMARLTWYDPDTNPSRFLAALWQVRHLCTRAEAVLPHTRVRGSILLVEAIRTAIDDYAEREMGNREYFWDRPRRGIGDDA